jgi:hypothetical protein
MPAAMRIVVTRRSTVRVDSEERGAAMATTTSPAWGATTLGRHCHYQLPAGWVCLGFLVAHM